MNPVRGNLIGRRIPPDLPVVAILTHLPNLSDPYHENRWEIVTASLKLARQNAGMGHHLLIWDNGSCDELREWLYYDFKPDGVMFTHNIGVMNAMRRIFGMYRDSIIAYSNDDILYYRNWLPEQIEILEHYPNVATVSGCLTKYYTGKADDTTFEWAKENAKMLTAATPIEWDLQHGASIGKLSQTTYDLYTGKAVPGCEYNGVMAIIGGNHCQIVSKAETLYPFLTRTNEYMAPLFVNLDMKINEAGLLRLMTATRRTRHLGNVLADIDREEINALLVEPVNA